MSFFLKIAAAFLLLTFPATAEINTKPNTVPKPFPEHLDTCLDKAATEFLVIEGKTDDEVKEKLWNLFLKTINARRLGSRAYGGNSWKNFKADERVFALRNYFDSLFQKGLEESEGVKDKRNTKIEKRLALRPEIKAKYGYDVVLVLKLDNGKTIFARILVNESCEVFDFGNGSAWVSRLVEPGHVDAYTIHKRKKARRE